MSKWEQLSKPPTTALKQIKGGRLAGMTDINPQWRYKAMHDTFGQCGEGWKYQVEKIWTENGADGQVFMFAMVQVQVKAGEVWSDPIPGIGGSMLLEAQKHGLHHNDEAPKMAVTDALSVALKMLGVGSAIYEGRWDGSKYKDASEPAAEFITKDQIAQIEERIVEVKANRDAFLKFMKVKSLEEIKSANFQNVLGALAKKANAA